MNIWMITLVKLFIGHEHMDDNLSEVVYMS